LNTSNHTIYYNTLQFSATLFCCDHICLSAGNSNDFDTRINLLQIYVLNSFKSTCCYTLITIFPTSSWRNSVSNAPLALSHSNVRAMTGRIPCSSIISISLATISLLIPSTPFADTTFRPLFPREELGLAHLFLHHIARMVLDHAAERP
jgi:hypothetical protein